MPRNFKEYTLVLQEKLLSPLSGIALDKKTIVGKRQLLKLLSTRFLRWPRKKTKSVQFWGGFHAREIERLRDMPLKCLTENDT